MTNQKTNSKTEWAQTLVKGAAPTQPDSAHTIIPAPTDEERLQAGRNVTDSAYAAVNVICSTKRDHLDSIEVAEIFLQLKAQATAIQSGDLSLFDAMLVNQAVALQSLFADLAVKASSGPKSPELFEMQLKLAMRAQNQCRATIQTLLESRNQTVFINNQANVSHGPQQVVNNPLAHTGAQARARAKVHVKQLELSPNPEQNYDLHSNDRTPIAAITANTRHPAVETLDRAEECSR